MHLRRELNETNPETRVQSTLRPLYDLNKD